MADKNFPGRSALEALFGAIKSSLNSKQNQTLSTTIAGSSTVEGALQSLEQSYSGLDYSELNNKPQINGVELSGNKTASELGIAIPTNLSDLNDDSTHRLVTDTEKSTWNGKADTADITNAINALDVASVGGTGKYISEISEADGKIIATAETMDDVPTENSNAPVKSGGIKTAIDNSVSLKTATGNPITLTDAANANAEKLLMTIEPIQDLHGYSKPWPAGGGKNKFNEDTLRMGDYNNPTINTRYSQNISDRIKCTAGTSYIISAQNANITNGVLSVYVRVTDANNIIIPSDINTNNHALTTPLTVTANNNGYLTVIFGCSVSGDTTRAISLDDIKGANVMIRLASETDATFEPWENICPISGLTSGEVQTTDGTDTNTATITFGQTVYGGEVDFKTGIVMLTRGAVDMGLLTWTYHSTTSSYSDFFDTVLPNDSILGDSEIAANIISPIYKTIASKWIAYQGYDNGVQALAKDSRRFITCDKRFNNAADYKNAMSGNILVYELATPIPFTLTPAELELLKGNNTITANGAEISIEYYPDNAIGALAERVDDKADKEDVAAALANKVEIWNNAGFHNSIYRGKYLGSEVTAEQYAAIAAGTFDDMYIGDYWIINGVIWRIAAFDYWLNTGDSECTTHHVVLVPDTNLDSQKMNDSNVTTGGYVGSKMYTSYITTARNKVISAFGSANILSHRQLFSNAVDGNYASNWAWYDSTIDLMSESMVYGAPIGGKAKVDSINFNIGIDKVQLPLFALDPSRITIRAYWWLRDVVSSADFAGVNYYGSATDTSAGTSLGVRPAFAIKAQV